MTSIIKRPSKGNYNLYLVNDKGKISHCVVEGKIIEDKECKKYLFGYILKELWQSLKE